MDHSDDGLTHEVDQRLEEIFGEKAEGSTSEDETLHREGSDRALIRELKATALSLDWEITDETLSRFMDQAKELQGRYEGDSNVSVLLQLLRSLGKYIKSNKGRSHPDAVKLLNHIFNNLERTIVDGSMSEDEKRRAVLRCVKEFRRLKEDLASGRVRPRREEALPPASAEQPDQGEQSEEEPVSAMEKMDGMAPHEAFAYALEEIKETIKSEFKALRAELKLWRESR